MSNAVLFSRAPLGIEAPSVRVEVHVGGGMPSLSVVGMAETAVREARDRVRSALENAGFEIPMGRVTVSLAPADLPKQGGWFDLPIALGIVLASGQVTSTQALEDYEFAAELALQGHLQSVKGLLPAVMAAQANHRTMVSSLANAKSMRWCGCVP